jgi:hypothetical protein
MIVAGLGMVKYNVCATIFQEQGYGIERALSARGVHVADFSKWGGATCLSLQYSTMLNGFNFSLRQLSFNTSIALVC